MARGLMTYPMGGTIDGRRGDHILLAPPFIVEESHLEIIVDRLHGAHRRGGGRSTRAERTASAARRE